MAASKVSGFGSASRTTILLLTLIEGFFFFEISKHTVSLRITSARFIRRWVTGDSSLGECRLSQDYGCGRWRKHCSM